MKLDVFNSASRLKLILSLHGCHYFHVIFGRVQSRRSVEYDWLCIGLYFSFTNNYCLFFNARTNIHNIIMNTTSYMDCTTNNLYTYIIIHWTFYRIYACMRGEWKVLSLITSWQQHFPIAWIFSTLQISKSQTKVK